MWQQMTERALNQIKEQQKLIESMQTQTTYKECYDKKGFIVKELGTAIDEEVCNTIFFNIENR